MARAVQLHICGIVAQCDISSKTSRFYLLAENTLTPYGGRTKFRQICTKGRFRKPLVALLIMIGWVVVQASAMTLPLKLYF
jgi:hypothetical protein